MPEYTACLDAGDAHHTFTPENSSKPTMKKRADKSKINTSKTPDNGGRSSKNGEIEAYPRPALHVPIQYRLGTGGISRPRGGAIREGQSL